MAGKMFLKLTDVNKSGSFINKLRQKRMQTFDYLINDINRSPIRILDIGGTASFWELMGYANDPVYDITVLNIKSPSEKKYDNIKCVIGDATDLEEYGDHSFDMVFSNSVIEHVGGPDRHRMMAEEMKRVGDYLFLQTPNYYFPMEPHFLFPCIQFLPISIRGLLIHKLKLNRQKAKQDYKQACDAARSITLLKKKELCRLFPGYEIQDEKVFGLTNSFIVTGKNRQVFKPKF